MLWETFNNLRDTITDQWIWFSVAGVFAILVVVVAVHNFYKSKPSDVIQGQQEGWTPTGRVDFTDPQSIGNFILQAEDTRIVDSIGGVEHREIRWRKATIDEAKTVVVAYHTQRNLTMTANLIVNSPIRRKSDLDSEHQIAEREKDETLQRKV
jgi:hypothetical protein